MPEAIDGEIARLKLESLGVEIDVLTPEQGEYLHSWDRGRRTADCGSGPGERRARLPVALGRLHETGELLLELVAPVELAGLQVAVELLARGGAAQHDVDPRAGEHRGQRQRVLARAEAARPPG